MLLNTSNEEVLHYTHVRAGRAALYKCCCLMTNIEHNKKLHFRRKETERTILRKSKSVCTYSRDS